MEFNFDLKTYPASDGCGVHGDNVVKENTKRFIGGRAQGRISQFIQLKLGVAVCVGLLFASLAGAQVNDSFASASGIAGITGTTNANNTLATLEACETNQVFTDDLGPTPVGTSVWYKWVAPASGTVQFDTVGSDFDTVISAWTTTNGLCDASLTNLVSDDDNGFNVLGDPNNNYSSYISMQVLAGNTYYISVDGNGGDFGNVVLNWNMTSIPTISAGSFKFATSQIVGGGGGYVVSESDSTAPRSTTVNGSDLGGRVTVTRLAGSSGRVLVDCLVSALTYTNILTTNYFGTNVVYGFQDTNGVIWVTNYITTSIYSSNSYGYFNNGYKSTFVTGGFTNFITSVTNTLGFSFITSAGGYTTNISATNVPPLNLTTNIIYLRGGSTNGPIVNADGSISITITNIFVLPSAIATQIVTSASGFILSTNTLVFDDYQMSASFVVGVTNSAGPDFPFVSYIPSLALISMMNPRLDSLETQNLIPPTIDVNGTNALISALSPLFTPGPGTFNFERSTFRVNRDVGGGVATISVYRRYGNAQSAVTVDYEISPARTHSLPHIGPSNPEDYEIGNLTFVDNSANTFPLQAASDYATPGVDYTVVSGTLSWGAFDYNPKTITIPILNSGLVEFNQDLLVQLHNPLPIPSGSDPGMTLGLVNAATMTILFDNAIGGQQPAGSADRTWNRHNFNGSNPPFLQYPGTSGGTSDGANGNGGTVYAIAEQPDGKAILAGSFISFDSHTYNRIVRVLPNGFQDSTFLAAPNTGANGFIASLALQPDGKIIAAGNFTSFNGTSRQHIVRLNTDGTVDSSFNPGLGANGMVWSVVLQSNGQLVIGGEFTTFNTNNVVGVARLNSDGTVDTGFSPGSGPDGTVNTVAVDNIGRVLIGGNFEFVAGNSAGGVARLNVDGSVDTTFNLGIGTYNPNTGSTDPIYALAIQSNGQVVIGGAFSYLDLNTANGLARLNTDGTVDTTFNSGTGTYNSVSGFADTIYAITLQPDGGILIGGNFQSFNQTRRIGLARLFTDGTVDTSFIDTAYNQFAGLINHYFDNDVVNTNLYPQGNQRNYVYAIALEAGGNLLIGGGFLRVGGGFTRDDILPRSNVARLIGNATPGPGNIQLAYSSYSADENAGPTYISLIRTNGNLGIVSATFTTNTADPGPGVAVPDGNFSLGANYRNPVWDTAWYNNAWMYGFGVSGPNYGTSPGRGNGANIGTPGVYVNMINDTNFTGNLTANVLLTKPNGTDIFLLGGENIPLGAALGSLQSSPLTIIDDNIRSGVLGFSSVAFTVVENQTNAIITVIRTNGSDGIVTVKYKTANGSGTNQIDYRGVTNTLTFAGGVVAQSFTVPIINNTTIQADRTVKLNLFNVTGGATLGQTNSVLTIIDDDYTSGHLRFSSDAYSTNENSGTAIITVNRVGGSAQSMAVTVISGGSGSTAVNGVNYTAPNGFTNYLTWAAGDATARTIVIPVLDDGLVTGNWTLNLRLTNSYVKNIANGTPLTFGGTNTVLTIVNVDSYGQVQFSSPIYSVKKYGGFAIIPVVRTGGSAQTLSVNYHTVDGSASSVLNHNFVATNGTLIFNGGDVSKFITVPITDDGTVDGPLALTVVLDTPTPIPGVLGSPSLATLNIIDSASVNEPPGTVDVTYSSTGFNNAIYALALQSNNKLLVGGDFTQANGVPRQRIARLNADGTLDTKFSLPSSAYGANGSIRAISIQTDGRIVLGGFFTNYNSTVARRITRINYDGTIDSLFNPGSGADNPVYALQETFVSGLSKMMVGGSFATLAGSPINCIARLNYDGTLDSAFNPGLGANGTVYALAVQPTDGKVIIGGDFTAVNGNTNFNHIARLNVDGSVDNTFNPGSGASHSVRALAIQQDGKILIGGLFTNVNGVALNHIARLTTSGGVDGTFIPGVGASDAVFSIALQSDTRIVLGGEFTRCSGVTRNRITRLNPDGTVDPTINFGTGVDNFIAAMVVQQDTVQGYPTNVPDEKIIVAGGFTKYNGQSHFYLARINGGSVSGSGEFRFTSAFYQANERGTNAVITVIRNGGTSGTNAAGNSDVIVPFATGNGSAFAGVNYTSMATNLIFPLGEVVQTIFLPVMDDGLITSNLTVDLTLSPLVVSQVGDQPTATLTIINDDSAIKFSSASYTVPKNVINGVSVININRLGSTSGTSTVTFATTAGGTASPGIDYTPVGPASVTFAPGISNAIVTIPVNNNNIPQGNRTVTLALTGVTGSALYSPSNAVLTIIDTVNAPGQLSFTATNYTVTEGGGVGYTNASITVQRSFGSAGVVSVKYFTADGTANVGTKYISTNGTLSFGDGEISKSFVVQVRNTTTAEGPQYLNLLLTNAGGGASIVTPTNATLTIINTNVGLAFASATNTFSETGGIVYLGTPDTVFVSVVRFNNTNVTSTVNYSTVDGTAFSNASYTVTAGTLTFNPGESVKTVPIALLHNTNVTGALSFTMNLSSPGSGAQLTYPSTTVIQLLDSEAGLSFASAATSVLKTDVYALLPVFNSNPLLGPISVNFATGGGTAAAGVDYTPTSGTLTFTNGQLLNYIFVPILPNSLVQSNQTFNVTLSSPTAPGVLSVPYVEIVTIIETNTPLGLNYFSPIPINSDWGSRMVDNNLGFSFFGSPSAWFAWTPTNSGPVEFDTIGSVDDVAGLTNLSTTLTVYTGTNFTMLNQVAANAGIYPNQQLNYAGQNIYNLKSSLTGTPVMLPISGFFIQPYAGPSKVQFNAVAGQTYYLQVQTTSGLLSETEVGDANQGFLTFSTIFSPNAGNIKLNWARHPSGVFRFATEELDMTGMSYSNGMPMLLYHVSETEANRGRTVNIPVNQYDSTLNGTTYLNGRRSGYVFDVPGMLVSVTRVAGSSGRVQVGYTTQTIPTNSSLMGTNGFLINGDLPASSTFTLVSNILGQFTFSLADYTPVSGTLTFDDNEMTKTIFIPIQDDFRIARQNRDFLIVLTNIVLDAQESSAVQPPRLDNTFSTALVRILDADISPQGTAISSAVITTFITNNITLVITTNTATNAVFALQPTNSVFNFQKSHYRVTRDASDYWGNTRITLYVNRYGTNTAASPTIHWRVNSFYLSKNGGELQNGAFPLQPGSDYATPTPTDNVGYLGLVPDFNFNGGGSYDGTVTFGSGNTAFNSQPITFTIANNGLQQFNEDFTVSLYELDSNGGTHPVGMIDQTTVTILSDDNHPPAGSVDEFHNADFSYNLAGPIPTTPPQMSQPGADGEILGLAVQPDNKTILVGDFFTYDQSARNYIARANTDGSLDVSFNPGSGPNNFVNCIALNTNYESFIGGAFSSYNGTLRNGIALINTNGTLDATFSPGLGFNGTVYALAFQTNGELFVAGDFTSYNGTTRRYLALLNADGSLDTSFDPGTNLNAAVYAIGIQSSGKVVVGGDFVTVAGISGQNHLARLNPDGSFDPSFDPGSGANASIFALGVQPDDYIVVGGQFSQLNGAAANNIARVTANGFTDSQFFAGLGADGPVFSITIATNPVASTTNSSVIVQTNFTVYVGGGFNNFNSTRRLGFARLSADGTVDTSFLDSAYNQFAGLPRTRYSDPVGTVLTSALQSDGNVMIGGSFKRVGGGQSDDSDVRPESIDTNNVLISTSYISQTQKTRAGIRNRNNIARLIGGATPGPGNIGLLSRSYSVNKSQTPMYVGLIRNNGSLGPVSASFSVVPGLAHSGVDYSFAGIDPLYWISWQSRNPSGRMHSDGEYGTNGYQQDVYSRFWSGSGQQSSIVLNILENTNSLNNLTAQFQLASPPNADQLYLGGEDIALGVALGESLAPLTIIDDHHQSGTFGFASPEFIGNGQSATISVARTNGTYGIVYLSYTTTTNGSTAILNSDYLASNGTMTFQPSDTNHTFNVVILNTNSISAAEKIVNLNLFGLNPPVNGIAALGTTNALLRIINPNFQGFVNLSSNAYYSALSSGTATITVTRNVGSKGTLTVQCASTNGTAISGTDYLGFTNTLVWNNGDVTPRIITVPLINNGVVGLGKQFGVALSNPTLNAVSTPSLFSPVGVTNATVFIGNDNSYGAFQFSSPSYLVNENGGYSTLTVIRTGGTNGTATVNFATANATALAGTSYVATNGTLTFTPGQLGATLTVPILNDGIVDPPANAFYFTATLSAPSAGATLGAVSVANNYIVDALSYNRPPGSPDTSFNTGAGMNADVYALALQSNGKIVAGGNFTIVNGVPENFLARLNTDGTLDRSGFLYGLAGASGAVYALVNQTDDQLLVGGTFTNFNGTVLNHIARLNTDGTLDSSFNPGAGADGTVYSIAETFIGGNRKIYAAGAFGRMNGVVSAFVARLNNNGTVDAGFNTGAGPNAVVYAVAAYPTNSVFAGKVLIGGAFTNVNNTACGHIARLNVDGSVDTSFNLNVATGAGDTVRSLAIQSDGKIVIGGDFTNFNGTAINHIARLNNNGTLDSTFTTGVGVGANATVSALALQTDTRIVVVGQFTLANGVTRNRITRLLPNGTVDPSINFGDGANGAVNAVVIQPADQMIVIGGSFTQYNSQPENHIARIYGGSTTGSGLFTFTASNYQVDENSLQTLIGIRRTGGTSGTNSVSFATTPGTAMASVNYSNVNLSVTFPPGEVLKFVSIPVRDDSNATPNLTVNLTLSAPTPPAGLGDQPSAVLTIINDDSAVTFGSANYSVPKNILTGFGTVHVLRLGSASGTCSVSVFTTTNGTAVTATDYFPTNLLVTFNAGQTDLVVQVPIVNNVLPQGNRTVVFSVSNAVNTLLAQPTNTTLTIIDTVVAPGQLSFAATNFTANASVGNATITVSRSSGSSGNVSASYSTVQGTATPGINYTPVSGSVTFNDGQTNATFTVPLLANNAATGPVNLTLLLSNPTGGAALINPTNATLTIINTNVVVAFALATNSFAETAGTVPVTVLRYNNTNGTSTVKYTTFDSTAFSNVNYTAVSGTLTFNPGEASKTVAVALLHNTNYNGTVNFTVNLSNPGLSVQLGVPSSSVVQITDVEAGLSFTNAAITTYKNGGVLLVPVVCANTNVQPVLINSNSIPLSVSYYTVNGTALAASDYGAVIGTLTFTNGTATNYIAVPIINNGAVAGDKAFSIILTNPTAPGVLITPKVTTVTIIDSNTGLKFSGTSYTVAKSGGAAVITVLRTDNTNVTSTVNYVATNGTAINGLNYTAVAGTLVFSNGITSQSFSVPVADTTVTQPDLTVLLQLFSPSNGTLIAPSAATLSIHDDTGSYVIPAGSQMVTNFTSLVNYTNGIIGSNDTVTLLFALRDAGGTNVNNLYATLLDTNGITPSGSATTNYGPLIYRGHSVSRPYKFVAHGTNNQAVKATFNLYEGVPDINNKLGTAIFGYTLGTYTTAWSNSAAIIINDNTNASPYPSIINVTGVGGSLIKATVTLNRLVHSSPSDVDALVVSPSGQNTLIMAHVGGQSYVTNVVLTFDDTVTNLMTHAGSAVTSTNKPSAILPVRNFP